MATVVEGDLKNTFLIAITPFPGFLHFILVLYLIMLSVKHHIPFFESLVRLDQGLNPDLQDMKVTVIIGALGRVTKGLVQVLEDMKIKGRVETIGTTALLRLARILRRVLET